MVGGIALFGPSGVYNAGYGVALQCDGKVLATGKINGDLWGTELAVVRFNADGSLDTTFASSGLFSLDFGTGQDVGSDIAIQADGRIVVARLSRSGRPTLDRLDGEFRIFAR